MIDPVISFTQGSFTHVTTDNVASTLMARDYKDPQAIVQKTKVKETNEK